MDISRLLSDLDHDGVTLWAEGGQLRFRAPLGALTDEHRALLRAHRDAILEFLTATDSPALTPDPTNAGEPFPLSDIQAAYLVGRGDSYEYGGVACHAYLELSYPDLDPDRLTTAWRLLITRHPMLRAVVHPDGYQVALPEVPDYRVETVDLRGRDAGEVTRGLEATRAELSHRVAVTDRWPLFALRLTRTDTEAVLHLSLDLLTVDYASVQLLLAELDTAYADPERLPPAPELSFRDYLLARRRLAAGPRYQRDRDYWLARLDDLPGPPELPLADRAAQAPPRFHRQERILTAEQWRGLRERAARHGVTGSAALLAGYAEVIGYWSRQPRFTLNLPTFSRLDLHPQVGGLVGDFTAVEPLAVDVSAPASIADRARELSGQLLADLDHPLFTGSEVLAELSRRDADRVLLPVVFTSALDVPAAAASTAATGQVRYAISQTPQVWLDCQVIPRGDRLVLSWDVRAGVFPDGLVEAAFTAYADLVERLATDDRAWVDGGSPVALPGGQRERRRAVNATAGPLPDGLLHAPLVARAQARPDAVAVIAGGRELSYRELLGRSYAVAGRITDAGAAPVAVLMDKGPEQVIGVLGALLAGGAYLPVDTGQPAARRNAILRDAGVRSVLTQSWLADAADWPEEIDHVVVDAVAPVDEPPPPSPAGPDDLAYVIYTSGSTGAPKGVMISHRAARNTVDDVNRRFDVGPDDVGLGLASLGFDLSVYDIFGLLGAGGRLVLPAADRRGDPSHWAALIRDHRVTLWNSVPGQLQMLHDYLRAAPEPLPSLRLAMLSGDWIPVTLPDAIRELQPELRLVSLGGATEGAIWSILHPIDRVDRSRPSIPYGRPMTNQTFHVLDPRLRDRPEWTPGELYIGGAGVALGYLNDPERTAERFLTHPVTGERLYRTGDLGRYLPDGEIEFLGREDSQVKIRGYRVELAEIEAAIARHPAVAGVAVVVDADHPAGKRLAAFVELGRRTAEVDPAATTDAVAVTSAAAAVARAAGAAIDPAALADFQRTMDEVAVTVIADCLAGAGLCLASPGHTPAEVHTGLRAAGEHRRIADRWLRALAATGRLRHDPDTGRYGGLRAPDADELARAWQRLTEAESRVAYGTELVELMRTSSAHLPALISGELDIRALLFPGTSDPLAAAYRDNLALAHLHRTTSAALRRIAEQHLTGDRLRVLEVGGGVAAATAELVPALAEYPVDYLFTDPSPFFLAEAREQFADHPWVGFGQLRPDEDLRAQGYEPNAYDVVVCANVLHNSPDAGAALARLTELLAPGGWLLLQENTRDDHYPLLVGMEFLEARHGPYTDVRAAGGQSFLTRPQWEELLAGPGLALEGCLPEPGNPLATTGVHLFLARAKLDRAPVTVAGLSRHTAAQLPPYMVPGHWQLLDALPVTGNGKLDRRRLLSWLPRSGGAAAGPARGGEPVDALERQLAGLWAELLDRERVGRDDDFFALGGDSLLVARLVGQLRERIPDAVGLQWEVVLRHMLRRPTVAALASYLRGVTGSRADADGDGRAAETPKSSPVVRLHGAGDDPLTVLVHAGTGTVMPYRALITELRRRSAGTAALVGLEIPSLPDFLAADPHGLIESLAAEYTRSLLELGAREIHVVGYCLGGLIATEVSRGLAEAGADVATLTVISSHSPRFRLDDEVLSEYSFAVMMGIAPADLGFPSDELRVAAAADQVLRGSPGVMRDGGFAALSGEFSDVAAAFRGLARIPREQRIARMCEAVPATAGMYDPEHMTRLFRAFRQSVFGITRYEPEPYAGDITFLRHSGAYPFPGSREAVTAHWEELCLGDLRIIDVPGDHFSCLSVPHVPGLVKLLAELTGGAVTR